LKPAANAMPCTIEARTARADAVDEQIAERREQHHGEPEPQEAEPAPAVEHGAEREHAHEPRDPVRAHDEADRPLRAAERAHLRAAAEERRERQEEAEVRERDAEERGQAARSDLLGPTCRRASYRAATSGSGERIERRKRRKESTKLRDREHAKEVRRQRAARKGGK
jgi:hypothetical protein